MMFKIILLTGLVVITTLLFLITRNKLTFKKSPLHGGLATILVLGGVVMTWYAVNLVESAWQKKQWPVIAGLIVNSTVVGEKRAFQPQITYRFYVDSVAYENKTDLHVSGFGNKRARRDNAKRIAGEYAHQKQVSVYYNPVNPKESYLRFGPYWSDYMKLMVGYLMLMSGFYLLLLMVWGKSKKLLNH